MEWAALKLDATRRRTVSYMPRVGGDPEFSAENKERGWVVDDARRP